MVLVENSISSTFGISKISWNIFLGKRNRDIRKKIKDFFEYKENKKEYDELKEVIDNHLDKKSLRKLKLENLKNNS